MGYRLPVTILGPGRLAAEATRLYAEALPACLPLSAPIAVAGLLPQLLARDPAHGGGASFVMIGNLAASLALLVVLLWFGAALLHRLARYVEGAGTSGESLLATARRLPALAGALGLAAVAAALPLAALPWLPEALSMPAAAALALLLAWAALRISMLVPEVLLRGHGAAGALRRSWRLTGGAAWRVLVAFLLVGLLVLAVLLAAALAAALLDLLGAASQPWVAEGVALVFVGAVSAPLGAAATLVIWNDLRLRAG